MAATVVALRCAWLRCVGSALLLLYFNSALALLRFVLALL